MFDDVVDIRELCYLLTDSDVPVFPLSKFLNLYSPLTFVCYKPIFYRFQKKKRFLFYFAYNTFVIQCKML